MRQQKPQNKLRQVAASPYKDLYIYYLQGRLKSGKEIFQENFIGNWEEDNFSFLFFSSPARHDVEKLLRSQAKAVADMLVQFPVKVIKTWTHDGIWHTFYGKRC